MQSKTYAVGVMVMHGYSRVCNLRQKAAACLNLTLHFVQSGKKLQTDFGDALWALREDVSWGRVRV